MERGNSLHSERVILERQSQTRFVGMSVTPQFYEQIKQVAQQEGVSASQLLRKSVVEYIIRVKR